MNANQEAMFKAALAIAHDQAATVEQRLTALAMAQNIEQDAEGIPTESLHHQMHDGDSWQMSFDRELDLDLHPEREEDDDAPGR